LAKRSVLVLVVAIPLLAHSQENPGHKFYALVERSSSYKIFENVVNLREDPSTNSKVLRKLTLGQDVYVSTISPVIQEIEGMSAHWLDVGFEGTAGYVWGGLVATTVLADDYDGDGDQEFLMARIKTTGDKGYQDYLSSNEYEYKYLDNGVLLSDSPFDPKPPAADYIFTELGDRGFQPPIRILEASHSFADAEYGYDYHVYYYLKGNRFRYIFDYSDQFDQGYSQKSTVLFPADGPKNAIEYSRKEKRTDPETGKVVSDTVVEHGARRRS
jgi:hypothetical protein